MKRSALVKPTIMPDRSDAVCVASSERSLTRPPALHHRRQHAHRLDRPRRCGSSSRPADWRGSGPRWPPEAPYAVSRSLRKLSENSSTAAPIASMPSSGCSSQTSATNSGTSGGIEQEGHSRAADEALHNREIAQRLRARFVALQPRAYARREEYRGKTRVQPSPQPHHDRRAQRIEHAQYQQCHHGHAGEHDQCLNAPCPQHPVVDVQHVEGIGQHQRVHDQTEQADNGEGETTCPQRFGKRIRNARSASPSG